MPDQLAVHGGVPPAGPIGYADAMDDIALSLAVLLAIALIGGAVWQWRRSGPDRNVWLMLVLAAVVLANVAIWVVPDRNGVAPVDHAAAGPG
ncbi:MAG TPA: hypothetical protein VLM18_00500 [Croceibacterium sp.]|nr:hypothetical protein [Croceibacterium sp.]